MNTRYIFLRARPVAALAIMISIAACGGGGGDGGSKDKGGNNGGGTQTNQPPTISGTPENSVSAGQEYVFTPTASDADGDSLSFQIDNQPYWLTFDSATGSLTGTPYAAELGDYMDIVISVSDGRVTSKLQAFGLTVTPQVLGKANFDTRGDVFETGNGYQSVGTLVMSTGERSQEYANSDLVLEFDAQGNLVDLAGDTDLPVNLSDNVAIEPGIHAIVGTLTGAEINANPDFGIKLMDNSKYFVFYVDVGFSISITNPTDPSDQKSETLEVPKAGQIILITDPTDPMLYRYASAVGKGAYGHGQSFNALLPFEPDLDYPGLDSFTGHTIETGLMQMQIKKKVNLANVIGTRVIKNASFFDIDWEEPLASPIEYRAGINGTADIGLDVLGVGLFDFSQAELGATIDVGLDRQQAALALHIDAEVVAVNPWVPDWFHVVPSGAVDAEAFVNGDGSFSFDISGSFQSTIPPADVSGMMKLDNESASLAATTVEEGDNLTVSLEFSNDQTVGRIEFPESYAASIVNDVSAALDREIANIEQALQDLQDATADYEFEASLRGLREALPPMMDAGVTLLNSLPNTVYDRAYDDAIDVMATTCKTVDLGVTKVKYCIDDVVDEVSIAKDIARKAKSETATGIESGVDAMKNLKARALEADDEQLREALRLALDYVYNNRTYSRTVTVKKTFSVFPFEDKTYTLYSETYTRKILSDTEAQQIATARDNVWRIQATSDIMIQAQQIYDQLPTEEAINQVKQGVQDGTQQVPVPGGLGYRAVGDTYDAFITVDGVDHITEINVLRPSDVRTGVSDLLAALLLKAI